MFYIIDNILNEIKQTFFKEPIVVFISIIKNTLSINDNEIIHKHLHKVTIALNFQVKKTYFKITLIRLLDLPFSNQPVMGTPKYCQAEYHILWNILFLRDHHIFS